MDEWVRQAEAWAGQAEHWIRQQPPEQIYVAVAVIIVTILVLVAASCLKSSKPNTIVLSGLSGSGKTVLFYQVSFQFCMWSSFFCASPYLVIQLFNSSWINMIS
uniref:Signal recognition particle receptor subunit beta n=1 Tax=Triticum urartu TaxID=4572 RepID=A0A8R7QX23_TRIUA